MLLKSTVVRLLQKVTIILLIHDFKHKNDKIFYRGLFALQYLVTNACIERDDKPGNMGKRFLRLIADKYAVESLFAPLKKIVFHDSKSDRDNLRRLEAIKFIGMIGDTEAVDTLVDCFSKNYSQMIDLRALDALVKIKDINTPASIRLASELERRLLLGDELDRPKSRYDVGTNNKNVSTALRTIQGKEFSLHLVQEMSKNIKLVDILAERNDPYLDENLAKAEKCADQIYQIRIALVHAKRGDVSALSILVEALLGNNSELRQCAVWALEKLRWKPTCEREAVVFFSETKQLHELAKLGDIALPFVVKVFQERIENSEYKKLLNEAVDALVEIGGSHVEEAINNALNSVRKKRSAAEHDVKLHDRSDPMEDLSSSDRRLRDQAWLRAENEGKVESLLDSALQELHARNAKISG